MSTARRARSIAPEAIEASGDVRELDPVHVTALAGPMAVRGLIVPAAVRPLDDHGERFALVAGEPASPPRPNSAGRRWPQ